MINPSQPIKDPVTKRRLRRCANRYCGHESYGNSEGQWSRRKFGKGKFFWLCQPCAAAYKNNQFCDFCKQIYVDTGVNK